MAQQLNLDFKKPDSPTLDELLRATEQAGKSMKKTGEIPSELNNLKYYLGLGISSRCGGISKLFFLKSRIITCEVQADELQKKGKDKESAELYAQIAGLRKEFKAVNQEAILLQDARAGLLAIEEKVKAAIEAKLKSQQDNIAAEARQSGINLGEPSVQIPHGGLF